VKAIDLLINSQLPDSLKDPARSLDKKGVDKLLADLARSHPGEYPRVVKALADAGRHAAYYQGETLTLNDMRPVVDREAAFKLMDREVKDAKRMAKDVPEFKRLRMAIWSRYADSLEKDTITNALAQGNNLGNTVISGARGNPFQLKAMVTTPAMYTDYRDRPIERFVRRSFGEGLRPADYLASAFGVRKSVLSTKNATAETGDFGKQLVQGAANLIVTEDDCGTTNGLDFEVDDPSLRRRVLAKTYKDVKAGEVIDKGTLPELRKLGVKKVIARSPLTCQSKQGICAKCLGELPEGHLAPIGYAAGVTAGNAISEPLTQGSLSSKHTAGGFQGTKKVFSGFDVINQIAQSPDTFPHRAAVAEQSGKVTKIEDAPQGGKFVYVGDKPSYVLPDYDLLVKPGDEVEAGDQLSDGIVDVTDIIRTKGLGDARRYYVDRMQQALEESGAGRPTKLNLELIARGTLDHVRVDDPDGLGDYLPDDTASYNRLSATYSPPTETAMLGANEAVGQYLESPALHFTIGTKLTPKMAKRLGEAGITHVSASNVQPKFEPDNVRLRASAHTEPDWMARMHSSYLTSGLSEAAGRAREADPTSNVHFAPALMRGADFGKKVRTTGKF
jgi:DNA-directed RNA polymerase subunit beta'